MHKATTILKAILAIPKLLLFAILGTLFIATAIVSSYPGLKETKE